MCGIAGILNLDQKRPVDRSLLVQMTRSLSHRGPDDHGVFVAGPVGLGHQRLAILDIEGGHQPWQTPLEDRALVYNGEIYNYREIQKEEERKGATFVSTCDTEVLMHLAKSPDSLWLNRPNGIFAFAH